MPRPLLTVCPRWWRQTRWRGLRGRAGRATARLRMCLPGRDAPRWGRGSLSLRCFCRRVPARAGDAYLRFIPRTEMDIAVVSAGVSLVLDEAGQVAEARIALGAVAPTVVLVPDAAAALTGTALEDTALEQMARACEAACAPIDDKRGTVAFRTEVAGVLAKRAARTAYARAGGVA